MNSVVVFVNVVNCLKVSNPAQLYLQIQSQVQEPYTVTFYLAFHYVKSEAEIPNPCVRRKVPGGLWVLSADAGIGYFAIPMETRSGVDA